MKTHYDALAVHTAERGTFQTRRTFVFVALAASMFAGFSELVLSSAYYVPYLLVAVAGFSCLCSRFRRVGKALLTTRVEHAVTYIFALLFAMMVFLANYDVWGDGNGPHPVRTLVILLGTYVAFWSIFSWVRDHSDRLLWMREDGVRRPWATFVVTFMLIAAIDLLVLFLCKYPGNLTLDNISQIRQVTTGIYTNHHPFYHTLTIGFFLGVGNTLFHDVNAAVATYSTFSVLVLSASFAFGVATIDELRAPRWIVVMSAALLALMPYHIMYSMTMWKDVSFGVFVLLFSLFFFRIMNCMSLVPFNWAGLVASGLGVCLFRSNGLFVFFVFLACFLTLYRLRHRHVLAALIAISLAAIVLKYPVLSLLEVSQPDITESISIPLQQMARDITENADFNEEERDLLSQVVDMDEVAANYLPYLADPIKILVVDGGNESYLTSHAWQFLQLYLSRMAKHPSSYLKGWVDQTKGYWNSGYEYWRWFDGVVENHYGIERLTFSRRLNDFVNAYLSAYETDAALHSFLCIGLADWIALGIFFFSIIKRDRLGAMLCVPMLAVVLSLIIATPVAYEFRYDYAVFSSLPIVLVLVTRPCMEKVGTESKE